MGNKTPDPRRQETYSTNDSRRKNTVPHQSTRNAEAK